MVKKWLITLVMVVIIATIVNAQSTVANFALANEKLKKLDEVGALQCYQAILQKEPNNIEALCKATFYLVRISATSGQTKANILQSKLYAEKAIRLAPNNAECNYVYGLALGKMVDYSSITQKVANSRLIKLHADKALAILPNYALAWNMLGRYNLEISKLSKMQKMAANSLMGGLPEGDLMTAINCLEKCRKFDASFIANYEYLIEAYLAKKDIITAQRIASLVIKMPNNMRGDDVIKERIRKMISK